MKPETSAYLVKADQSLEKARRILEIDIPDEAGRHAYYAAYHAAQAVIFERTDKAAKTHQGIKKEFTRIARSEPSIDQSLPRFLSQAYGLKSIADYETGSSAQVSPAVAAAAIAEAAQFVAAIRQVLAAEGH